MKESDKIRVSMRKNPRKPFEADRIYFDVNNTFPNTMRNNLNDILLMQTIESPKREKLHPVIRSIFLLMIGIFIGIGLWNLFVYFIRINLH